MRRGWYYWRTGQVPIEPDGEEELASRKRKRRGRVPLSRLFRGFRDRSNH